MLFLVVGNQNPLEEPQEIDADRADLVQILPPYGNGGTNYIIAITVILSSIIFGNNLDFAMFDGEFPFASTGFVVITVLYLLVASFKLLCTNVSLALFAHTK